MYIEDSSNYGHCFSLSFTCLSLCKPRALQTYICRSSLAPIDNVLITPPSLYFSLPLAGYALLFALFLAPFATASAQRHPTHILSYFIDGDGGQADSQSEDVGESELASIDSAILPPDEQDNCPAGYFHCNTTAQCVPQRANCDGQVDCDDTSDEWNCVNEVDAKYWDHLFRKNPFGRQGMDDKPIGECSE